METETVQLNKKKILSSIARQVLYNCLMSGKNQREAAKEAGLKYSYARRICAEGNITALVKQEKQRIEAETIERLKFDALKIKQEVASIAFSPTDSTIRPVHKLQALDMLSRYTGLYELDNAQQQTKILNVVGMDGLPSSGDTSRLLKAAGKQIETGPKDVPNKSQDEADATVEEL